MKTRFMSMILAIVMIVSTLVPLASVSVGAADPTYPYAYIKGYDKDNPSTYVNKYTTVTIPSAAGCDAPYTFSMDIFVSDMDPAVYTPDFCFQLKNGKYVLYYDHNFNDVGSFRYFTTNDLNWKATPSNAITDSLDGEKASAFKFVKSRYYRIEVKNNGAHLSLCVNGRNVFSRKIGGSIGSVLENLYFRTANMTFYILRVQFEKEGASPETWNTSALIRNDSCFTANAGATFTEAVGKSNFKNRDVGTTSGPRFISFVSAMDAMQAYYSDPTYANYSAAKSAVDVAVAPGTYFSDANGTWNNVLRVSGASYTYATQYKTDGSTTSNISSPYTFTTDILVTGITDTGGRVEIIAGLNDGTTNWHYHIGYNFSYNQFYYFRSDSMHAGDNTSSNGISDVYTSDETMSVGRFYRFKWVVNASGFTLYVNDEEKISKTMSIAGFNRVSFNAQRLKADVLRTELISDGAWDDVALYGFDSFRLFHVFGGKAGTPEARYLGYLTTSDGWHGAGAKPSGYNAQKLVAVYNAYRDAVECATNDNAIYGKCADFKSAYDALSDTEKGYFASVFDNTDSSKQGVAHIAKTAEGSDFRFFWTNASTMTSFTLSMEMVFTEVDQTDPNAVISFWGRDNASSSNHFRFVYNFKDQAFYTLDGNISGGNMSTPTKGTPFSKTLVPGQLYRFVWRNQGSGVTLHVNGELVLSSALVPNKFDLCAFEAKNVGIDVIGTSFTRTDGSGLDAVSDTIQLYGTSALAAPFWRGYGNSASIAYGVNSSTSDSNLDADKLSWQIQNVLVAIRRASTYKDTPSAFNLGRFEEYYDLLTPAEKAYFTEIATEFYGTAAHVAKRTDGANAGANTTAFLIQRDTAGNYPNNYFTYSIDLIPTEIDTSANGNNCQFGFSLAPTLIVGYDFNKNVFFFSHAGELPTAGKDYTDNMPAGYYTEENPFQLSVNKLYRFELGVSPVDANDRYRITLKVNGVTVFNKDMLDSEGYYTYNASKITGGLNKPVTFFSRSISYDVLRTSYAQPANSISYELIGAHALDATYCGAYSSGTRTGITASSVNYNIESLVAAADALCAYNGSQTGEDLTAYNTTYAALDNTTPVLAGGTERDIFSAANGLLTKVTHVDMQSSNGNTIFTVGDLSGPFTFSMDVIFTTITKGNTFFMFDFETVTKVGYDFTSGCFFYANVGEKPDDAKVYSDNFSKITAFTLETGKLYHIDLIAGETSGSTTNITVKVNGATAFNYDVTTVTYSSSNPLYFFSRNVSYDILRTSFTQGASSTARTLSGSVALDGSVYGPYFPSSYSFVAGSHYGVKLTTPAYDYARVSAAAAKYGAYLDDPSTDAVLALRTAYNALSNTEKGYFPGVEAILNSVWHIDRGDGTKYSTMRFYHGPGTGNSDRAMAPYVLTLDVLITDLQSTSEIDFMTGSYVPDSWDSPAGTISDANNRHQHLGYRNSDNKFYYFRSPNKDNNGDTYRLTTGDLWSENSGTLENGKVYRFELVGTKTSLVMKVNGVQVMQSPADLNPYRILLLRVKNMSIDVLRTDFVYTDDASVHRELNGIDALSNDYWRTDEKMTWSVGGSVSDAKTRCSVTSVSYNYSAVVAALNALTAYQASPTAANADAFNSAYEALSSTEKTYFSAARATVSSDHEVAHIYKGDGTTYTAMRFYPGGTSNTSSRPKQAYTMTMDVLVTDLEPDSELYFMTGSYAIDPLTGDETSNRHQFIGFNNNYNDSGSKFHYFRTTYQDTNGNTYYLTSGNNTKTADGALTENKFYRIEVVAEDRLLTLKINGVPVMQSPNTADTYYNPYKILMLRTRNISLDVLRTKFVYNDNSIDLNLEGANALNGNYWRDLNMTWAAGEGYLGGVYKDNCAETIVNYGVDDSLDTNDVLGAFSASPSAETAAAFKTAYELLSDSEKTAFAEAYEALLPHAYISGAPDSSKIKANVYFELPNFESPASFTATIGTESQTLSGAVASVSQNAGKTMYKLSFTVPARKMSELFAYTLTGYSDTWISGETSVADYAHTIATGGFDASYTTVAEQMLVYGRAAEVYFGVTPREDSPTLSADAPSATVTAPGGFTAFDGASLKDQCTGASAAAVPVIYSAINVTCLADTTLSIAFTLKTGVDHDAALTWARSNVSLNSDSDNVFYEKSTSSNGKYKYVIVSLRNVPIASVLDSYTLTFANTTYSVSVLDYLIKAQASTNANLVNLTKALYEYAIAVSALTT